MGKTLAEIAEERGQELGGRRLRPIAVGGAAISTIYFMMNEDNVRRTAATAVEQDCDRCRRL